MKTPLLIAWKDWPDRELGHMDLVLRTNVGGWDGLICTGTNRRGPGAGKMCLVLNGELSGHFDSVDEAKAFAQAAIYRAALEEVTEEL